MTAADTTAVLLAQSGRGAGVPIRELLLVLLTSAVVTFLATGVVRIVAVKFGAVAVPRDRDVHVKPTPRMGGVGMYIGLVAGILFAQQLPALTRGFEYTPDMGAALVAASVIVVVGIVDDRWGLDALTKFVGQVTAAGVLVVMGVSWIVVYDPFSASTLVLDQLQGGLITVGVAAVMINAMNFVDGLDGLAAGLGLIAALAICAFSVGLLLDQGGDVSAYPPALMAAALAGACLGFLPHNFQPAKIFMGDSGSMMIGLMLAAASTSASGRINYISFDATDVVALLSPLFVVAAVLFLPLLDLVLAVIRRTRRGESPFAADKMHLHHRLLEIGHSQRRAVLLIYLWAGMLAFGAVAVTLFDTAAVFWIMCAGLVVAAVVSFVPRLKRQRENTTT